MKLKLRISIFGILMLLILLFGDSTGYALIAVIAAAVHETGHIVAALILRMRLDSFSLGLLGARLGLSLPLYSYRKELLLSLSGPVSNIVTGGAAIYIYNVCRAADSGPEPLLFFSVASMFLAGLNLLPVQSFDGGRIFMCLAAPVMGIFTAERVLRILSFSCILLLWGTSVYLMLRIGSSLALFVFSSALFAQMFLGADAFKK
ncbi:MAG: hypothetical protein PUJ09_06220 [Eubacteriales bacterium]|nr:hypothetical protein [Eubacteriales bacterium]